MPRVSALNAASSAFAPRAQRPLLGIFFFLLSFLFLTSLDGMGKWTMSVGVPLLVFCWFRYAIHLVLLMSIILPSRGLGIFKSQMPKLQCLRGAAMLGSALTFFTTLSYLPQAEATALIFIAPLLMLAVAPWVLKEPSRQSRWIAAGIGLIGVLIVVRPSAGLPLMGVIMGLITACLLTAQHLISRMLARDSAFTTVLWGGAIGTGSLTLCLPFVWPSAVSSLQTLSAWNWTILLLSGAAGGLGHLLQIQSYRYAPASLLAPFIYLQIIFAATIGWLVWSHLPDTTTWIGIIIICASGIVNSLIEWRRSRS